jgi:uncharacterized membrane protein YeaQ/YmgE (transglycosylase-associated protein family)
MNLLLWIIGGALLGTLISRFNIYPALKVGSIVTATLGSVFFGWLSTKFMPDMPTKEWDYQFFSPIALFWATVGSLIVVSIFNWVF